MATESRRTSSITATGKNHDLPRRRSRRRRARTRRMGSLRRPSPHQPERVGALNEAFSDIMGTSVEFFYQQPGTGTGRADYLIGRGHFRAVLPGVRDGDRSFENPALYGQSRSLFAAFPRARGQWRRSHQLRYRQSRVLSRDRGRHEPYLRPGGAGGRGGQPGTNRAGVLQSVRLPAAGVGHVFDGARCDNPGRAGPLWAEQRPRACRDAGLDGRRRGVRRPNAQLRAKAESPKPRAESPEPPKEHAHRATSVEIRGCDCAGELPPVAAQTRPAPKTAPKPRPAPIDRVYLSVNGMFQAAGSDFEDTLTYRENAEDARVDSDYSAKSGPGLDLSGGVVVLRGLGVGVGVTGPRVPRRSRSPPPSRIRSSSASLERSPARSAS